MAKVSKNKKVLVESVLTENEKSSIATLKSNVTRYNEINAIMEELKREAESLKESICSNIKTLDVDEVDLDNGLVAGLTNQTNISYKDTNGIIKTLKDNDLDSKYLETTIRKTDLNKELKAEGSMVATLLKDLIETTTTTKLSVKVK